ncbi:hypothetical protein ScPMuIL_006513 [Solemya velum]
MDRKLDSANFVIAGTELTTASSRFCFLQTDKKDMSSPKDFLDNRSTSPQEEKASHISSVANYSHQSVVSQLDEMNKSLDDLREKLVKNSIRCHLLEVDLASQFSPVMVDTLRNVKRDCNNCTAKANLFSARNEGDQ